MRIMENKIEIPKEKRDELISILKNYFLKEKGEELGDLGAGLMIDFISEKMGPIYYNQGVADAYKYLDDRLSDVLELQKY